MFNRKTDGNYGHRCTKWNALQNQPQNLNANFSNIIKHYPQCASLPDPCVSGAPACNGGQQFDVINAEAADVTRDFADHGSRVEAGSERNLPVLALQQAVRIQERTHSPHSPNARRYGAAMLSCMFAVSVLFNCALVHVVVLQVRSPTSAASASGDSATNTSSSNT